MVAEPISIERKRVAEDELSFERLRREGISAVQALSGTVWTDYNTHDPGVTILEHLCYALTDVVYRADFKIEDYLTGDDGHIDYAAHGLHSPEDVYTSRPSTLADYRKVIFDAIPELENLSISKLEGNGIAGLYRLSARVRDNVSEDGHPDVVEKIRKVYAANRNLCEDLAEISIVHHANIELDADLDIEIGDDVSPSELLAQVYYRCARLVTGAIRIYPYESILNEGKSLEEILTGPFCRHGYIKAEQLNDSARTVYLSDIFSVIKQVEGVSRIRKLSLLKDGKLYDQGLNPLDAQDAPRLQVPVDDADIKITLFKDGRLVQTSAKDLRNRYEELSFVQQSHIHALSDMSVLYHRPEGARRDLRHYTSIQNEFPAIYGINAYGVPDSAPEDVKAKALQLKGYLLIFEQFIVNQLANLQSLGQLFSTTDGSRGSYGVQAMQRDSVADLERLYPSDPTQVISAIVAKYDDHAERKNRLLDYMLALYGESYPQDALRHFNRYYSAEGLEYALVYNKLALLKQIVAVGRDRGAAYDYSRPAWNTLNISGLKRKVSLLLGCKHQHNRSYTLGLLKRGLKLVSDDTYRRMQEGAWDLRLGSLEDISEHVGTAFHAISASLPDQEFTLKQQRRSLRSIAPFKHNVINDSLFRDGIDIRRYRVGSLTSNEDYQLFFQASRPDEWWYLGSYDGEQSAVKGAHALQRFLMQVNQECEGLHVLEHVLLRPEEQGAPLPSNEHDQADFYSLRISVLFPAWSARCDDANFRHYAEELVRENCPAHLVPDCHWLDFSAMGDFERRYLRWLKLRQPSLVGNVDLEQARAAVTEFMQSLRN